MKTIFKDVRAGFVISFVIVFLSSLFEVGLMYSITGAEEFHYVVSLKTWIIFILLVILATTIGWVFLRSINVTKKTPSRAVTLLMSFLWGVAYMVVIVGSFVIEVLERYSLGIGLDLGRNSEMVASMILALVIFITILVLLRWIYSLSMKYTDVLLGGSLVLVVVYIKMHFGWRLGIFFSTINVPYNNSVWYSIYDWLRYFLIIWSNIVAWYLFIIPYFRNIFRRPSTRELTAVETKRREQVLLMVSSILIAIAILVVNLYFPQVLEKVMRAWAA